MIQFSVNFMMVMTPMMMMMMVVHDGSRVYGQIVKAAVFC